MLGGRHVLKEGLSQAERIPILQHLIRHLDVIHPSAVGAAQVLNLPPVRFADYLAVMAGDPGIQDAQRIVFFTSDENLIPVQLADLLLLLGLGGIQNA